VADRENNKSFSFETHLKPLLGIADAILAGDEEAAMAQLPEEVEADMQADMEEEAPVEEAPVEEAPVEEEAPPEEDMSALIEVVGEENAAAVYEAAQQREDLAGLPVEELAAMIEGDMQLRMDLMKLAAANEMGMEDELPLEEMPVDMAAAGPDMGMGMGAVAPPAGMLPPGM
jgi:hypothetical protein